MKKLWVIALLLAMVSLIMAGCKETDDYPKLKSSSLPATTSFITVEEYRNKVKGALVGQMIGVSYGRPVEFRYKKWIPDANLPVWRKEMINEGYNQDDIYLALTGIEALSEYGLDVTSRELAIDMYNRDFEFWNGSNNDVLARGYAPPYSGYPKYSTDGDLTTWFPDGNSYQCGGALGGMIGLNMFQFINNMSQKFAEICTYGDGIYGMQFIGAMYGSAFFTDDIREIINAGLSVIPQDSWSALVINDVLNNYDQGMTAEENFNFLDEKYIQSPEYNWIPWPYDNILLDAKMCSAFTVIGLIYGEGDIEKTMKYAVKCANDTDSTAAAAVGILCTIKGYDALTEEWIGGLKEGIKFKYTRMTIEDTVETCEKVLQEAIKRNGGQIAYVDNKLSFVIPQEAKQVAVGKYQNSKYPDPMEKTYLTEEEKRQMRLISDPGFERMTGNLANGWSTTSKFQTKLENMKGNAYTGINNILINSSAGWQDLIYLVDVKKNTNYEISCMVNTNPDFSAKIELFVKKTDGTLIRKVEFYKTADWTKISLAINSGESESLIFGIGYTGKNTSDWLRVDDFGFFYK